MNPNNIKSFWIRAYDEEPDVYSLEIETSICTITYSRVRIGFIGNGSIVFPAKFEVLDDKNNVGNIFTITTKADELNNEATK